LPAGARPPRRSTRLAAAAHLGANRLVEPARKLAQLLDILGLDSDQHVGMRFRNNDGLSSGIAFTNEAALRSAPLASAASSS
jgi:hypothetical protein